MSMISMLLIGFVIAGVILIWIILSPLKLPTKPSAGWFISCKKCGELVNGDVEVALVENHGKCSSCISKQIAKENRC